MEEVWGKTEEGGAKKGRRRGETERKGGGKEEGRVWRGDGKRGGREAYAYRDSRENIKEN